MGQRPDKGSGDPSTNQNSAHGEVNVFKHMVGNLHLSAALLGAVLFCASVTVARGAEIPARELAEKLDASTAHLYQNGRSQCTATKIGEREWLTAGHCAAFGLKLELSDGTYLWTRSLTVAVSEKADGRRLEDWAILHTTEYSPDTPALELACGEKIYQGQPIAYFGFPHPTEKSYLQGYIASVRKVRTSYNDSDWVIDVPAAGGASGSAIVDRNTGKIIGVLTEGILGDRQSVGFYLTGAESVQNLDQCEDWNKAMEEWDEDEMGDFTEPMPEDPTSDRTSPGHT